MRRLLLAAASTLLWTGLWAQTPKNDRSEDLKVRLSGEVEYKIAKGQHVFVELELTEGTDLYSKGDGKLTFGYTNKILPNLRLGAGYVLLTHRHSHTTYSSPRHRIFVEATPSWKLDRWKFSLRERFQATCRTGDMNTYQAPRVAVDMRTRLKVEYSFTKRLSAFAFAEPKWTLNRPRLRDYRYDSEIMRYVTPAGDVEGEPGWFMDGYRDMYITRTRVGAGFDKNFKKGRILTVYFQSDFRRSLKIDANSEGTKLKSLVWDRSIYLTPGVKFTRSF